MPASDTGMILGVDPGYAACGICAIERLGQRWVCFRAVTVRTPSTMPLHERMGRVYEELRGTYAIMCVGSIVACERQDRARQGSAERATTSSDAALVEQVVGMVRTVALSAAIPFVEVDPQQAKIAVLGRGHGGASKEQVRRAVMALVSGCPKILSSHAADAIVTAIAAERKASWEERKRAASIR